MPGLKILDKIACMPLDVKLLLQQPKLLLNLEFNHAANGAGLLAPGANNGLVNPLLNHCQVRLVLSAHLT